jgi:tRNA G18 (ribose-2'-O)-methylase SpoU
VGKIGSGEEVTCLAKLQSEGFSIVVLEQTPQSISLYDFSVPEKVVYVVGNEVTGVDDAIIAQADQVVLIPMAGEKESLNVATATGILLFHR